MNNQWVAYLGDACLAAGVFLFAGLLGRIAYERLKEGER